MGKNKESINILNKISEITPDFPYIKFMKALIAFDNNDFEVSRSLIEDIKNSPVFKAEYNWILSMINIKQKNMKNAKKYLEKLLEMNKIPDHSAFFFTGILYGLSGDKDNMYQYFNKSIDARESDIIYINQYKVLKPFHKDPGYQKIINRLGLPH